MELTREEHILIIKILLAERFPPETQVKPQEPQQAAASTTSVSSSHTYYPSAGMYWNGIQYVSSSDKKQG